VLGTLVSDDLVDQLGVSLWSATGILCAALAACFTGWSCTEHSLSVRSVVTRRCEAWYWLAVLCAVSLATAVSDLVSATLSLGYASLVLCCLAAVMTGAHARVKVHGVAAFWAAYVVTRTLGDSVADLMSAPARDGALGLGTIGTVAIVLVVILVFVVLSTAAAHRSGAGQVGSPTVRP